MQFCTCENVPYSMGEEQDDTNNLGSLCKQTWMRALSKFSECSDFELNGGPAATPAPPPGNFTDKKTPILFTNFLQTQFN